MMERFDVVLATFQPKRRDDLSNTAISWIGLRTLWQAGWLIEQTDGSDYVGDWAMVPYDKPPRSLPPIGWVPLCDLVDVEYK